eukprot:403335426
MESPSKMLNSRGLKQNQGHQADQKLRSSLTGNLIQSNYQNGAQPLTNSQQFDANQPLSNLGSLRESREGMNEANNMINCDRTVKASYCRNLKIESPESELQMQNQVLGGNQVGQIYEQRAQSNLANTGGPHYNIPHLRNSMMMGGANSAKVTPRCRSRALHTPNDMNNHIFSSQKRSPTQHSNLMDQSVINEDDFQNKIDQIQEHVRQDQERQAEQFTQQIGELNQQLNQTVQYTYKLEQTVQAQAHQILELQGDISQKIQDYEQLQKDLGNSRRLNSEQKMALDALKEEIENKQRENDHYDAVLRDMEDQMDQYQAQAREQQLIQANREERERQEREAREMKHAFEEEKRFQENKQLMKENDSLKRQIQDLHSIKNRLESDLSVNEELKQLRIMLSQRDQEVMQMKKQLDPLSQKQLASLTHSMNPNNQLLNTSSSINQSLNSTFGNFLNHNAATQQYNFKDIGEYRAKLIQKDSEIHMIHSIHKKTLEEMRKQIQELRDSLLKKNLSLSEKDLQFKSFRFNTFIGTILSAILVIGLLFIVK